MSDKYLEAAAKAYAEGTPTDTDREIVTDVIEAWVGDREPLYQVGRLSHNDVRNVSELVGVSAQVTLAILDELVRPMLVRVSVGEGEPT